MQLKFLTLGFISVAVFSSVVYASVATVHNTDVDIHDILTNILNDLNANNALKNATVDAVSHVASDGGDVLHRSTLARGAGELDEEEEDEKEPDEEEADKNEPNEADALKLYRHAGIQGEISSLFSRDLPYNVDFLCFTHMYENDITPELCGYLSSHL